MRLALDTAFAACSVAIGDLSGKVLADIHKNQRRGQAETLAPMVEKALKKAGIKPADITEIILTTGPGTFAGVRIAAAFARALALSTGAKLAGFTSFEALAGTLAVSGRASEGAIILALVPGKRGEASGELFRVGETALKSLKGAETMAIGEIKDYLGGRKAVAAGPDLDTLLAEVPDAEFQEKISLWPKAANLLALHARFGKGRLGGSVSPFYLRPADAKAQKPGPFFTP